MDGWEGDGKRYKRLDGSRARQARVAIPSCHRRPSTIEIWPSLPSPTHPVQSSPSALSAPQSTDRTCRPNIQPTNQPNQPNFVSTPTQPQRRTTVTKVETPEPQSRRTKMCKHYAHTHSCGHTRLVFAAFCPPAALRQQPCRGAGEIWATLKIEGACPACPADAVRGMRCVGGEAGGRGSTGTEGEEDGNGNGNENGNGNGVGAGGIKGRGKGRRR